MSALLGLGAEAGYNPVAWTCLSRAGGGGSMTTDRIEINSQVMLGKPVIRGTRIPVELLLRKISEGASLEELLDAYPRLSREDILAAVAYAADSLAHEETIFLSPDRAAAS